MEGLIPECSPLSTAEAQGSDSVLAWLTYPASVFSGLTLTFSSLPPCCDFRGPDTGSVVDMLPGPLPAPRVSWVMAAVPQHKV